MKGATTSKSHYDYLLEKKAEVYWLEKDIRKYTLKSESNYRTQAGQVFEQIIKKFE